MTADADPLVARLRAAGCVYAEDEAAQLRAAASGDALEGLVARRVAGEPLEQVLGYAEFAGLRVVVAPGVFVPRRRTELMVAEAVRLAPGHAVVVDLCCGSGAVGAALAARLPDAEVWAADVDPAAVACARRNLPPGRVLQGDLFAALPSQLRECVHVLAANVPYVPTDAIATMPPEARDHEPPVALDGGVDGLALVRRVAAGASAWLTPGGSVLVETSRAQAPTAVATLEAAGLVARVVLDDEVGGTVVVGTRPAPPGVRPGRNWRGSAERARSRTPWRPGSGR